MKLATCLVIFYAAFALAGVAERSEVESDAFNVTAVEDDFDLEVLHGSGHLEKRKSCSGNRLQKDVCQGNSLGRQNSFHNCYNRGGHCCARKKNRDYGITVSNQMKKGEDCGYCFTGYCKQEKP